jgi:sugar/nucleoside kinase (ribokinase family)
MMKIAAVGECTIDRYLDLAIETIGGISLNYAVNARQCGASYAALITCTGDDEGAAPVRDYLARAQVDSSHVTMRPGPTAVQEIVMAAGGERIFAPGSYKPGVLSEYALSADDIAFLRSFDVIHAPYFRQIEHIFSAAILNPDLQAARIVDFLQGTDCGPRLGRIVELFDTLTIAFLSGGDEAIEILLPETRHTQTVVVVTHGAAGSTALRAGERRHTPALHAAAPVDTTGCGDAFQAAFTVEYLQHRDLDAALRAGAHQAARVLTHYGATALA